MIKLSKDCFLRKKTSNSIVILGSGYSINKIDGATWDNIKKVDSISFNWFCKYDFFVPSFFLVREQANTRFRTSKSETTEILFSLLNKDEYVKKSTLIIVRLNQLNKSVFDYSKHINGFVGHGIVVNDVKGCPKSKFLRKDIFSYGIFHGDCTITSVLHLCIYLGYKNIYFAGVDLYDSRYFWLRKDEIRHTVKKRNQGAKSRHKIFGSTLRIVNIVKKKFGISMFTINPKSLLTKIIPFSQDIKI